MIKWTSTHNLNQQDGFVGSIRFFAIFKNDQTIWYNLVFFVPGRYRALSTSSDNEYAINEIMIYHNFVDINTIKNHALKVLVLWLNEAGLEPKGKSLSHFDKTLED